MDTMTIKLYDENKGVLSLKAKDMSFSYEVKNYRVIDIAKHMLDLYPIQEALYLMEDINLDRKNEDDALLDTMYIDIIQKGEKNYRRDSERYRLLAKTKENEFLW